jgi:hypothetical protein
MGYVSRHMTEPCGSKSHLCGYLIANYQAV